MPCCPATFWDSPFSSRAAVTDSTTPAWHGYSTTSTPASFRPPSPSQTTFPLPAIQWTVPSGVRELHESYVDNGLTFDQFTGSRYLRIKRVQELQEAGRVDGDLRWLAPVGAGL